MNGRELLLQEFDLLADAQVQARSLRERKSVHEEIWKRFPDEVERTARSRVRDVTDLALASSMHHYVAYALGAAVPGSITSRYTDLSTPNLEGRFHFLLADRTFDALCLNDNASDELSPAEQLRLTREFLETMFPVKSPFET